MSDLLRACCKGRRSVLMMTTSIDWRIDGEECA